MYKDNGGFLMKFEKITDTKIRITLSLRDMQLNNISVENVLANSADSQKLLETIITRAEKKLGFKTEDSKLLVEAIAPSNEECIFTITKLLDEKICIKNCAYSFIFKFDHFDDFINLCTFLNNFSYLHLKDFSKNFSLIFYNGTYYLQALNAENFTIVLDYMRTIFTEFGKDVSNSAGIAGILNEYGKVIFSKNAIRKCIRSFAL